MVTNFVNNQNSSKNQRSNSTTFDIRNFIDQLEPAKEKGKYICPVCSGHNLSIDKKTGKYQCFNGCECRDIREAIAPREEKRRSKPHPRRVLPKNSVKPAPEPVLLPDGELAIARLVEIPLDIPMPAKPQFTSSRVMSDLLSKGVKEEELKEITVTTYDYGAERKAHRYQAPSDNPKGYEKTFAISRVDSQGKTQWNKGKYSWAAYRQLEAIAAMQALTEDKIPVLLSHEGEKCVEAGRAQRLAGITSLGNSNEDDLVCILNETKFQMGDRVFILAHCRDNDETGIQKAEKLALACVRSQIPFVAIDLKAIKPDLCEKGDIYDILASGMDGEELAQLLLEQIKYVRLDQSGLALGDEENEEVEELVVVRNFNQVVFDALYGDKPWICANEKLYCWEENYYEYIPQAVEIKRIRDFCNNYSVVKKNKITFPYANSASVSQILSWVKMSLKVDDRLLNPPGVNCTNGVLKLHWSGDKPSWKLSEHSPRLYYTYRPIATYDPEADPFHCDRLLEALEPAQREIFLRTIAASLDLKTVRQYKGRTVRALLLKGDGSNGKDSLREVVALMYGFQGMSGCTLTDFAAYDEGRKFSLAKLSQTRVNWSSENANSTRLDKIQSLKAFITGEPLISERKGVDGEEYEPQGIAIFNINDIPTMQGALEAILSRYGILEFLKTFKVGADPSLGEIEADPRFKYDPMFMQLMVVPAFLNRVLQALVDLMRDGIDYSCTRQALEAVQVENCHLWQFCQDLGLHYDPQATVTAGEIWSLLEAWYQDNGTLTYDGSKALWADPVRPSDKNVKAVNQIIPRFLQLFPKAKRVTLSRSGEVRGKAIQAIAGIGFVSSLDNSLSISDPVTPISQGVTPMLPQPLPQKTTLLQGCYPSYPNFSNCEGRNEKTNLGDATNLPNAVPFFEESTQTPGNWGNRGNIPSVQGFDGVTDRGNGGVTNQLIGVTNQLIDNEDELKPLSFTLKVGDRIRCFPTSTHAENRWQVTAKILSVESDNGWFGGCAVEYRDKKKGVTIARIAGGNFDWILSKLN